MPNYRVQVPYIVWVSVEVEADSRDEAEEIGIKESALTGFCGNGGSDKLVGVYGSNSSVYASEFDEIEGYPIEVDEVDGDN